MLSQTAGRQTLFDVFRAEESVRLIVHPYQEGRLFDVTAQCLLSVEGEAEKAKGAELWMY